MPEQQKITDPNWGLEPMKATVQITDPMWGSEAQSDKPKPKLSPNTIRMRSMADMIEQPTNPDGTKFRAQLRPPPRGTLPVLAGLASAFIPGAGALRAALSMGAGGAGEAVDEVIHGEPLSPMKIATEAAIQGVPNVVPKVAGGLRTAGQKAVLNAGLTEAQRLARPNPTMGELGMDLVSSVPALGRTTMNAVGHTLYKAGQLPGKILPKAATDAVTPNTLRNLQLLYRVLTGREGQ